MIKDFIEGARGLAKNPLGIIALFISLIYGFACLVLGFSVSNLEGKCERLPLIWFIILFPLIILIAFIYLVVKHHKKLYAPSDFRNDDAFMQTLDEAQIAEKRSNDVQKLESAPDIESNAEVGVEEVTKKENVTEDMGAKKDDVVELSEYDLLKIYENSQKWVINELSLKYNVSFKRNVVLINAGNRIELDAIGKTQYGATYILEIKYWQTTKSDKKLKLILQDFVSKAKQTGGYYERIKIIIALVYENLENVNKNDMISFVEKLNRNILVLYFDYNELKKNYE